MTIIKIQWRHKHQFRVQVKVISQEIRCLIVSTRECYAPRVFCSRGCGRFEYMVHSALNVSTLFQFNPFLGPARFLI